MLVAILLAVVCSARALATDCPAGCVCAVGGEELEYICRQEETVYQITGVPDSLVKILCETPQLDWSRIPTLAFSSNGTLESLTVSNCELPTTFASVLARFGANDARWLILNGAAGELTAERVAGLSAVETIMMVDAADQTRIPYDVFDALPLLRDFRLRDARLQLAESGGDSDALPTAYPAHPALRSVELASSGITDVPPGAFLKLAYVNKLYLWGNNIENFTSDSFMGLDHLEKLDLSKNPLTSLPPRAFSATRRLRKLDFVATNLSDVASDALQGLPALEEVSFKFGRGTVKFGPRALAALPALKKLTIDRTSLHALPEDLLDGSTAIEELTIKGTGLEALPEGLFSTQQRIKKLDLSKNKIKTLHSSVFKPLKTLEELNLDGNNIEEFPDLLFKGLTKLTSVSANSNGLKYIAEDAFQEPTFLEYLFLNDNLLTLTPKQSPALDYQNIEYQSPFNSLFNLKELHLQGNLISQIFIDWKWSLIKNFKKLDLSWNNITYLTKADLQFLAYDLQIDLRHNKITTIDVLQAPPGWTEDEPRAETNTVMLLGDNPYRCDCELFMLVRRLHGSKPLATEPKLDFKNAKCASPPALAGRLLKDVSPSSITCSLRSQHCPANCTCDIRPSNLSIELDCQSEPSEYPNPENDGLKITKLRLRSLQSLILPSHVVSLNLTGLGLTASPLLNSDNVKDLDLSGNQLTMAPVELLKMNVTLRLARNPFGCDCSHVENVRVLQKYKNLIDDANNVTCSGGESFLHKDVARLCDVKKATIIGSSLVVVGIFVAVLAALMYCYALEIKVFLYSRGWCRRLIKEDELDKDAKYDAFVSFSEKDARWVSEHLLPKLEGPPNNFKMCVHYRDWILGDMIPAQIARSVEQSRRTIVVLSKNFLESTWAQLEFRAANVRAQRERRPRVLVIVLEDVSNCEKMDAELRAYLSTNTYVKWGDRWFWEKLIYAMPHKKSGFLNDVFVADELKGEKMGIDARLNSDGKIVNNVNQKF